LKKIISILVLLILINSAFISASADDGEPFRGLPSNAVLSVSELDNTGALIYVGIDFAVFQDEDKDGVFTVKAGKVKRFLTTHTTITVDLGSPVEYKKGVMYKLAMRTLYTPAGPEGNGEGDIIIADYSNGREGWVLDSSYSTTLKASAVTTSGAIYQGELWNKDMLNKWGNYIPKELTFTVDAVDSSGTVLETLETMILIDNRDLYYRVKEAY